LELKKCIAQAVRSVPFGHEEITSRCSDSDSSDRSLPADILLREAPEDEEEEDEEEHDGGGEDEDRDEGYSE
jgi:hypothetical protein